MAITVTGRKINISDALRNYAEEKVEAITKVMDINPVDIEVVLYREKNPANPLPACCEITLRSRGRVIRAEEHEEDMHAAIDVATAKVQRQLRKLKTRVIDKHQREVIESAAMLDSAASAELDLDALMADLSDDEIVRIKEIEFAPLTTEEALVQIDLLGHDFFAYIDRDTNLACVLYRRNNGGYGLLKQKDA